MSLNKVGDVRMARGDLPGALAAYEDGLTIRRRLTAADPSSAAAAQDVSVSLSKVGDVQTARGDLPGALAAYEEGVVIRRASERGRPIQRDGGPGRLRQPQ